MILERIEIICFRNLKNQMLDTPVPWVSLSGKNAQGKSNVLEAVTVLANGKNYRDGNAYAVPWESDFWSVRGKMERRDRVISYRKGSTTLTISGKPATPADFMRTGGAVYVDDRLFWKWFSFPEERRKYLDRLIFLKEPEYLFRYQEHHRILRQRNAALASGAGKNLIESLTDQFIDFSLDVNRRRVHMARELDASLAKKLGPADRVCQLYYPEYTKDTYRELAGRFAEKERAVGHSRFGPQREDVTFLVDRKPAGRVLSLGQKKRFFLLMALAAAEQFPGTLLVVDDYDADLDEELLSELIRAFDVSGVQKITAGLRMLPAKCLAVEVCEGKIFPARRNHD